MREKGGLAYAGAYMFILNYRRSIFTETGGAKGQKLAEPCGRP